MDKHTPGPWKARDCKTKNGDIWIDCDAWVNRKSASCLGGTLATAHGTGTGNGSVEANARLIAAAPNMLAALKAAVPVLEGELESRTAAGMPEYEAEVRRPLELVRAAIAKAEGK